MALEDLYHNPDPLFRLIGEPNEAEVVVEGKRVKSLIDSGAQISSISDKLAKSLGLKIHELQTLLDLEPTEGGKFPMRGTSNLGCRSQA